jgi:hypothetical protein
VRYGALRASRRERISMKVKVLVEDQKRLGSMLWKEGIRPCGSLFR